MSKNNKHINQAAEDIVELGNILARTNSINAKVIKENKDKVEEKFPNLFEEIAKMTKDIDTKGLLAMMEMIKKAEEEEKAK